MKPRYSIGLAEKFLRHLSHYKLHILVLYYLSKRAPHHPHLPPPPAPLIQELRRLR